MASTIIYPARRVLEEKITTPTGFAATCAITDLVGDPVVVTGVDTVSSFATNVYPNLCVGIILEKSSATECVVVVAGIAEGVTSGLTPSKAVFVSTSGGLTTTKPATGHLQAMGTALTSTDVIVNASPNKVIQS